MSVLRVMFVLEHDSGLPEDQSVNVWHFNSAAATAAEAEDASDLVVAWYNTDDGNGHAPRDYLSPVLSGAWSTKVYDLSDAEPRVPMFEDNGSFAVGGTDPMPSEIAVCLSFQGNATSGGNQARRRGRIYLGPLDVSASDAQIPPRPSPALIESMRAAANNVLLPSNGNDPEWCVYSRVDDIGRPVTNGWIDNAFDVQRRRGERANDRTLFSV